MNTQFYLLPREVDLAIWGEVGASTHRYNNDNTYTVVAKLTTDARAKKFSKENLTKDLYVMDNTERIALMQTPEWTAPEEEEEE